MIFGAGCRPMVGLLRVIVPSALLVFSGPGRADAPPDRYTINDNGTVKDNATGLLWQQGFAGPFVRSRAQTYCSELRLANTAWRLPTMKELQTLVDRRRWSPAIDLTYFPRTPTAGFWTSSSIVMTNPVAAWLVDFDEGRTADSVGGSFHVRCVR